MKQSKNGSDLFDESERPAVKRSKFRFRIVQGRPFAKPDILWLTNDRDYASLLINVIRGNQKARKSNRVWLEEWREAFDRFSWRYVEEKSSDIAQVSLKPGENVAAMLLDERTRRGGWRASVAGSNLVGPITNSDAVPRDKVAGDTMILTIGAINTKTEQIHFRWNSSFD